MSYKFYQILFLLITQFQIYFAAFEQEYPGTIICQNDNVQIESLHSSDEKIKIMNIMKSKNCTHVQGSIYIQGLVNLPNHLKDLSFDTIEEIDGHLIIEGNDLEKITFKNLRMIRGTNTIKRNLVVSGETEFSFIVAGNKNLIELDLRNLRYLHANLSDMPAMNRFSVSETSLEFLGLKSLKEINGEFLFMGNDKLCYMKLLERDLMKKPFRYFYQENEINCLEKICDLECKGCWGPGNNMCYECENLDVNGVCVNNI